MFPCPHGILCPHVADGGTASNMDRSREYTSYVPKVMRMILKMLLNIRAIIVYPLQNGLLVIEYSICSAATPFIAVEKTSLEVFTALVEAAWKFSTVPKLCILRWVFGLGYNKKSHGFKSGLYGEWGNVVILF
jgi:hypothetical protein